MTPSSMRDGHVETPAVKLSDFGPLPPRRGTQSRPARVCLATPEISGPIFSGGVGTFYASLADALVRHGHQVTIAYALGEHCDRGRIGEWISHYARRGIELVSVPEPAPPVDAPLPRRRAYAVYRWLREREAEFDIVHFPEWQGVGFYAVSAKRQRLAFAGTSFVVVSHSPTMYLAPNHLLPFDQPDYLEFDFLERGSVECADYLVSPSTFLLQWMRAEQWRIPNRTFVHPLILPLAHRTQPTLTEGRGDEAGGARRDVREIVFFGRLDVLKGLDTFCGALDRWRRRTCDPSRSHSWGGTRW